jgi:hypothetical protein
VTLLSIHYLGFLCFPIFLSIFIPPPFPSLLAFVPYQKQKLFVRQCNSELVIMEHSRLTVPSVYDFIHLSPFNSRVCFILLVLSVVSPLFPRVSSLVPIPYRLSPSHWLTSHFLALSTSTIRRIRQRRHKLLSLLRTPGIQNGPHQYYCGTGPWSA